jgi:hypothetical protein
MSDTPKFTPETTKAATKAAKTAIDTLATPVHADTEPFEPLSPELLQFREQLPFAYIAYSDSKEQKEGKNLSADKEFLEFIKNLNPNYRALFRDFVDEKQIWTPETFHEKIEFFKSNFSLPLSDQEAIQALTFLNKDQNPILEVAQKKVEAWRKLATEWGCSETTSIISLARGGFNIKETALSIRDQHADHNKGLCYDRFEYIKGQDFEDVSTNDEIRFLIPMLVPGSRNKNFERQTSLIDKLNQTLKQQCPQWNIQLTIGEANQIANQILAHYNNTGERTPYLEYTRTSTIFTAGGRLLLGRFNADGLRCMGWRGLEPGGGIGVSALGTEKVLGH